jgi:hypothetical protein
MVSSDRDERASWSARAKLACGRTEVLRRLLGLA